MTKKMIGIRLDDYIDSDYLEGSVKDSVFKLLELQDKYSLVYKELNVDFDWGYNDDKEYYLEGMRLETGEEYSIRLEEGVEAKRREREWKLEQFDRLKKELGEE